MLVVVVVVDAMRRLEARVVCAVVVNSPCCVWCWGGGVEEVPVVGVWGRGCGRGSPPRGIWGAITMGIGACGDDIGGVRGAVTFIPIVIVNIGPGGEERGDGGATSVNTWGGTRGPQVGGGEVGLWWGLVWGLVVGGY